MQQTKKVGKHWSNKVKCSSNETGLTPVLLNLTFTSGERWVSEYIINYIVKIIMIRVMNMILYVQLNPNKLQYLIELKMLYHFTIHIFPVFLMSLSWVWNNWNIVLAVSQICLCISCLAGLTGMSICIFHSPPSMCAKLVVLQGSNGLQ